MGNASTPCESPEQPDSTVESSVPSPDRFVEMGQGRPVLSYGDTLVYEDDMKLLEPKGWINDTIVGFAMEYFAAEKFKGISKDLHIFAPSVSQFLKLCQGRTKEDIDEYLEDLKLHNKEYIIVPVNDATSHDCISGTHWTILAYSKKHGRIVHFDSFGTYNSEHAKNVKMKIGMHLEAFKNLEMKNASCPQQENYVDCGLYAICVAEEICKNIKDRKSNIFNVSFTASHAFDTRDRLRKIILSLANS